MPIPTEPVGSLPRPSKLQAAIKDYDSGKVTLDELRVVQDEACLDSIKRFEATGSPVISDGEQRISSFATYKYYAVEFYEKAKAITTVPLKQAVIAPSMLALLYPLEGEIEGYGRDEFYSDLIDEGEKDIRKLFEAGCGRVSIDFTEGRLALKNDLRNPWTGKNMLQSFVDLNNRLLDRFSAEERKNIGIHTCPGGDCDSTHSAEVDYAALLPSMFKMNAGYFLIQLASEPDKERVYKLIGESMRADANGVTQVAFIGVINPLNPRVETVQEVRDDLVLAAKYIPKEQLGSTDDCGFSPFSIDVKPKHGSPDVARDIAFQKIKTRVEGTQLASAALGV